VHVRTAIITISQAQISTHSRLTVAGRFENSLGVFLKIRWSLAVFENLGIEPFGLIQNMPETRLSSLGVRGGGKSNQGCSLCRLGFTCWNEMR